MESLHHSPNKRLSESMTSAEYAILSDIVSSLGTYTVIQHKSTLASTRSKKKAKEEAELLLNFISKASEAVVSESDTVHSNFPDDSSTIPSDSSIEEHFPNYISPSLSFESNKIVLDVNDTSSNLSSNDASQVTMLGTVPPEQVHSQLLSITVSVPSLSLIDQVYRVIPGSSVVPHRSESRKAITSNEGSSSISNTIAESIVASVNVAMESRIKTWVKTLSKKAALNYESRVNEAKKAFVNGSTNHKSLQSDLHDIKDLLKTSTEARLINALANVASSVLVHDIRTTFHILEQSEDTCSAKELLQMPRTKKMRSISDESNTNENDESSVQLSHALLLEVKCTIIADTFNTTTFNVATPGEIHGSFTRVESEPHVNNIIVNLDTNVLAGAIERETRRIIFSYATESMSGQPFKYCTIHDTIQSQFVQEGSFVIPSNDSSDDGGIVAEDEVKEEEHSTSNVIESVDEESVTPKLGTSEKFLLTPKPSESIMVTPVTAGGQHKDVSSKVMPPPPPRLPLDGNTTSRSSLFLHPRRISPSSDSNPTIDSISMTPPGTLQESLSFMESRSLFTNGHQIRAAPPLVSPFKEMVKGGFHLFNNDQRPSLPPLSKFSFPIDRSFFGRRE